MRPARLCACGHRIASGERCPCERKRKAEMDAARPTSTARGYDAEWRKRRADFLAAHPTCAVCGATATVVDHVVPHKGDRSLFRDASNWQPLCKPCHDRKTASRDGSFGRPVKAR